VKEEGGGRDRTLWYYSYNMMIMSFRMESQGRSAESDFKDVAPVLFVMWRRPEATELAFRAIREVRPRYLYIACDGPRDESDTQLIVQCKEIVNSLTDWECIVKTRYLDKNDGCKNGVSGAIGWFFENVDEGIIIEDDVVCDQSFFYYATSLLEIYRENQKVGMISANSFGEDNAMAKEIYDFTLHPHIWGWASWKRVWERYDADIKDFNAIYDGLYFARLLGLRFSMFWMHTLTKVKKGEIVTWDYQFAYMFYKAKYVSARPGHELSINLGFGEDSTHSHNYKSPLKPMKRLEGAIEARGSLAVNWRRDKGVFLSNYWPLGGGYLRRKLAKMVSWSQE